MRPAVTLHAALGLVLTLVMAGCQTDPGATETPEIPTAPGNEDNSARDAAGTVDENGFTTTVSGLKYKIIEPGSDRKPTRSDTVVCHYRGRLNDGTEFDSSYKRNRPATFPLNGVIAGWTEGLQLIGEGGKIELDIPYQLGYGERGSPPTIPAKAQLHFTVELISVK